MATPAHLVPFRPVQVDDVPLEHSTVGQEQVLEGAPTTGAVELGAFDGARFGVWEMSVGGMRDVEVDEFFVVISGDATVSSTDPDGGTRSIRLSPGSACRLAAGSVTEWHATETLRKVYVTAAP